MSHKSRKSSGEKGHQYEREAERFLESKGFEILERNYRAGHKEIDLIVRKDNTVVFVEVKGSRTKRFGHPSERVTRKKQDNLIVAAEKYIIDKNLKDCDFRFDLITFHSGRLEYYPGAFSRPK
ncbi:MAG: YraN family protein [Candidatus Zixiibacteriota bacterium]|nr:MAG: YraN family protein [candidate division Zixibacteria bacterium]